MFVLFVFQGWQVLGYLQSKLKWYLTLIMESLGTLYAYPQRTYQSSKTKELEPQGQRNGWDPLKVLFLGCRSFLRCVSREIKGTPQPFRRAPLLRCVFSKSTGKPQPFRGIPLKRDTPIWEFGHLRLGFRWKMSQTAPNDSGMQYFDHGRNPIRPRWPFLGDSNMDLDFLFETTKQSKNPFNNQH